MTEIAIKYTKEELFQQANEGNNNAMYSIGYRYLNGMGGLSKDTNAAYQWFKKSADLGNQRAIEMLKNISSPITSNEPKVIPKTDTNSSHYTSVSQQYDQQEKSNSNHLIFPFSILILIIAIIIFMVKKTQKAEIEKSQLESELKAEKELWENELIKTNNFFNSIINEHIKTLSLKRKQTVKKDDYGNVFDDKWLGEIEYFINNVLCKDERIKKMLSIKSEFENPELQNVLSDKEKIHYQIYIKQFPDRLELSKRIIDAVHEYDEQELKKHANGEIEHNNLDIENLSPIEFEHYCADILKAHGWQVRVTQASGDQGIDVIGKYNNKTVAFQCKKYSNPVGNKAVQEIIAGKQFINADMAAVVTNATYTESAKQLANATNVYLLHYSELKYFAEKITNYYQTK